MIRVQNTGNAGLIDPPCHGRIGGYYFQVGCPYVRPSVRPSQKQKRTITLKNKILATADTMHENNDQPIGWGLVGHSEISWLVISIFFFSFGWSFSGISLYAINQPINSLSYAVACQSWSWYDHAFALSNFIVIVLKYWLHFPDTHAVCNRKKIDWSTRWPTITNHYFHTSFVRPHLSKQNHFQKRMVIATNGIVGLAEGIIGDTCLVIFVSKRKWINFTLKILFVG